MDNFNFGYSKSEERLNVITHFIGVVLSVIALFLMLIKTKNCDLKSMISALVFGLSMVILYTASTVYHNSKNAIARKRLNIFDHASIYILIAGSYTPYTLITLNSSFGNSLLLIVWCLAIVGVVLKLFYTGKYDKISTVAYVLMGWMAIVMMKPLYENLAFEGFLWLLIGGVSYTIGAVFYSFEKIKYNHAIFHVFVLFGTFSHFISIYNYVLCK